MGSLPIVHRLAVSREVNTAVDRTRSAWPGRMICCGRRPSGGGTHVDHSLSTLRQQYVERFESDGYSWSGRRSRPPAGLAMERRCGRSWKARHGIRRDDRSSGAKIVGDLKAAKRDPPPGRDLDERVRGVFRRTARARKPGRSRGTGAVPCHRPRGRAPGRCRQALAMGQSR